MTTKLYQILKKYLLELSFAIATAATVGSYMLSSVFDLVPCELCWYQRVFMFTLPIVFGVSALLKNKKAYLYTLPIIGAGFIIAAYHVLLQEGIIKEDVISCSLSTVSCATPQINWLGFITIPVMSAASFAALGALMIIQKRQDDEPLKIDPETKTNMQYISLALVVLTIIAYAAIQIINT